MISNCMKGCMSTRSKGAWWKDVPTRHHPTTLQDTIQQHRQPIRKHIKPPADGRKSELSHTNYP